MKLQLIDWLIVFASLFVCFIPALFFGKRAGKAAMLLAAFVGSGSLLIWVIKRLWAKELEPKA